MKTTTIYLSVEQAADIQAKLQRHLDDLLSDIRGQIVAHLQDIILQYLPEDDQARIRDNSNKIII